MEEEDEEKVSTKKSSGISNDFTSSSCSEGRNAAETSSSFSLDLSSTDFQVEQSTSGCSSELGKDQKYKVLKKARVKDTMNEIRNLLQRRSFDKSLASKSTGTLTMLQQVLHHLKKSQEKDPLSATATNFPPFVVTKTELDPNIQGLIVTLTCDNMIVFEVSEELTRKLDFPRNSWKGRCFNGFVLKKDVPTLSSSLQPLLTKEDLGDMCKIKPFYIRMRCYQSLSSGYDFKGPDYMPLKAKVIMKKRKGKVSPCWTFAEGVEKCFSMELQPCVSAYTEEGRTIDRMFTIQHSNQGKITYISKNTVNLLGYLPQDILGSSFAMLHDPEEYDEVQQLYKKVVSAKGQPCTSAKMRLKTRNDEWVVVETEWSCYLNPWSNQVDLIFSKHVVICEPSNTDIFHEKKFNKIPNKPEEVKHSQVSSFQKKILKILKQAVDVTSSSSLTVSKASEDFHCLDIGTSSTEQGGASGSKKIESSTEEQTESIPTDSSDNYVSYGHVNYTYNIQRFFQSCPLTLSSKQCEDAELSEKDHYGKGVDEFLINIPSVQPLHSDSSSVKVYTSDLEVAVGSPRANDDSQVSDDLAPPPNPQPVFKHVNLTQAALREHTKLQKKLYLKRVKEDKSITLTKPNKNSILLKVESFRKRNRDNDNDNECPQKVKKYSSNEEVKAILEKKCTPYPSLKPIQPQYSNTIPAPYGSDYRMFPQEIPLLPYGEGEDTTLTTESQYITDDREEDNSNNVKWPFYSNPGYLFSPSVMGGFYNSIPQTDDHTVTWPGPIIAGQLVKEEEGSTESVESTPTEDTSSTVPSLIDSKRNKREKHRFSKYSKNFKKSARNSASTSQVNTSPKISKYDLMRYEMPVQSRKQMLNKDKVFLNNNPSGMLCKEQLDCLVHDIDVVSCKKENSTKEEMMKLGQQLQAHMESSVLKEFGSASMEESKNIVTQDTNETCSNTSDVDFKRDSSVTSDQSDKNTSDSTQSEHPSDSFSSVKESDGSDKPCISKAKKIKPAKAEFHDKLFIELTDELLTDDLDFCLHFSGEDDLNLIGHYLM